MDVLSAHHPNQNVTLASRINVSNSSSFSLRCKLSELKQNISFLKFFHAAASWFGQSHTLLQDGLGNQIYYCGQIFAMQQSL
jgi:hypothetical protein